MTKRNRWFLVLSLLFSSLILHAQGLRYQSEIFPSYQVQSNITFTVDGTNGTKQLDLYTGSGDQAINRPLVLFIHGGGFKGGDKISNFGTLVCGGLAKRGYVVASINYRITSSIPDDTVHFEAMLRALQDTKAAVRFFRRYANTYGIDTSQIFATGSSAGSITALHLAYLDSMEVPAWVRWGNVGNSFEGASGNPGYTSNIHGVVSNWGALGDTSWVAPGDVPVYLVHGTDDVTVYYEQIPADGPFLYGSKHVFDRAQHQGVPSGLRLFANTGHTLDNNTTKQDSAYKDLSAWLYTILSNPLIGSARKLSFEVQPSNTITGHVISPAMRVQIQDSLGNLVTTATDGVTIAIGTNAGPGGVLSGTLTVSAVNGIATFNDLSIDVSGNGYTLNVTSGSFSGSTSNPFTIIPSGSTGTIMTTGSGNWGSTVPDAPWPGGIVPTITNDVVIADGHTVVIDVDAYSAGLVVGQGSSGILEFEQNTPRKLTVVNDVTIRSNAILRSNLAGTVTTHNLTVGGNLINNGTLDLSTNSNSAGAAITFDGSSSASFGGSGMVTNVRSLSVNKGNSSATVLELNPTNFTVQGDTSDGLAMGFLTLLNGTLKIAGSFKMAARVFPVAGYAIPASAGIWLDNPNFTVAGQNANCFNDGLLQITQGTFNIGTNSSNRMTPTTGSSTAVFKIEGGTLNIAGMLRAGSSTTVTLVITGGTINVTTVGNAGSGEPGFGFTSTSNNITISGGTINLVQRNKNSGPANRRDYNVLGGVVNITGGILNVGTGATTLNYDFAIGGNMPNLVLDNTTHYKVARLSGPGEVYGEVTINNGDTLDLNGKDGFSIIGNLSTAGNLTNNGHIVGTSVGSRLKFAGVNGQQAYAGSGSCGSAISPLDGVTVNNTDGVVLNSTIVTNRVNLFRGLLTNANKLTLGNSGSGAVTIQTGNDPILNAGSFDSAPNFQIGSGGLYLIYGDALNAVTTHHEIPGSRTVNRLIVNNSHGIVLAGGDLTVLDSIDLSPGRVTTASAILTLGPACKVSRTTGFIAGSLKKYVASGATTATFEIGEGTSYAPVTITFANVTAGGELMASTTAGAHPQLATSGLHGSRHLNRYYTLTNAGTAFTTADATFNFLSADVLGGANTANFIVSKHDGGAWSTPTTANPLPTSIQATGLGTFSDFAVGEPGTAPPDSFLVTVTAGPHGQVVPAIPVKVQTGGSQTFTFTPDACYRVDSVFDNGTLIGRGLASYTLTNVQEVHGVQVMFVQDTLTVTATAGSNGEISPGGQIKIACGSNQRFMFTPAGCYQVDSVFVNGRFVDSTAGYTITNVRGDSVITVSFKSVEYVIAVTQTANGTIAPGTSAVNCGSSRQFIMTPASGYEVDALFVDGVKVDSTTSYTFNNVSADHTITANFRMASFTLDVSVFGLGFVSKTPDLVNYGGGVTVEVQATANRGWLFSGWSGDLSGSANPASILMDAAKHVTATFTEDPSYQTMYRTFLPESLALERDYLNKLGKYLSRKPYNSEAKFSFIPTLPSDFNFSDKLYVEFNQGIVEFFNVNPQVTIAGLLDGKNRKFTFTFVDDSLPAGTPVTVHAHGVKGTSLTVKKYYFEPAASAKPLKWRPPTPMPPAPAEGRLWVRMPNRVNALYETFLYSGYGSDGMIVGKVRNDLPKQYGWFQTLKYGDVLKTLIVSKTGQQHAAAPHGFDVFSGGTKPLLRQLKSLPPTKFDNRLLADMIALKLSIVASRMRFTPAGLGELIYQDSSHIPSLEGDSNRVNGLTVEEIAGYVDSLMMGHYDSGLHKFSTDQFDALDWSVRRILSAFEGRLDTLHFADSLRFTGTRALIDVAFLLPNPTAEPPQYFTRNINLAQRQLPEVCSLEQNYPNPFNPTTMIQFDLADESEVSLTVYNMLGQKVATLLDRELLDEGSQEILFDAGTLSSGVYFYRLTAKPTALQDDDLDAAMNVLQFDQIRKMILVK